MPLNFRATQAGSLFSLGLEPTALPREPGARPHGRHPSSLAATLSEQFGQKFGKGAAKAMPAVSRS